MSDFPIVVGPQGYVPQTPASLNTALINNVASINPGYTATLPGTLIEDISSTDTYALLQCDSSVAELINSLTPYGANAFLLNQLGQVYGVQPQAAYNTSVYVQFTSTTPGWTIIQGFTISDGVYQYIIQDGGIIGAGGVSGLLLAIATTPGAWAIPIGAVNQLVTSIPASISLTVINPSAGVPAAMAETEDSFRSRTLQAGLAASQGMDRYLKTLVSNIPGVQMRLVSARLVNFTGNNQWEIIVGGGDTYQVANAIYESLFDITTLTGSVLQISGINNANPAVVTTALNHGYATGQMVTFEGITGGGFPVMNADPQAITVMTEKTFSFPVDSTTFVTYTGGGVSSPNLRNTYTSILSYPDTYVIPSVEPPLQTVAITVTWNTYSSNYVNPSSVSQLATPALVTYINSIYVGQPINVFEMNTVFQAAVASVIPSQNLTRLIFAVSINGIGVSPVSGTGEILGDPESYFYTDATEIVVSQG